MDLNIVIRTPDILAAAELLAEAIRGNAEPAEGKRPAKRAAAKKTSKKDDAPAGPAEADVVAMPAPDPAPVPVDPVRKYTHAAVSLAGGRLIQQDASKMPAVQALLLEFGISEVVQLPDDRIDAFAERLIELGAVIE